LVTYVHELHGIKPKKSSYLQCNKLLFIEELNNTKRLKLQLDNSIQL
jgi:hypothetical protein